MANNAIVKSGIEVPDNYSPEAHKKVTEDLENARAFANELKKDVRKEQSGTLRKDTHANALIAHIIKKSGWAGLVHAVAAGESEYGNKSNRKMISPEASMLIESIADELEGIPSEALTDKERIFMNVWNGSGEFDESFENDIGLSAAMADVDKLKDKSKQMTREKNKHEKLYNQALSAAAGSNQRHAVDVDINSPGQWRGFRVVGEGASNGYAMRIETDENGEKRAVGYLTYGDNQADTDHDKVFDKPLSEFGGDVEKAFENFKWEKTLRFNKEEGSWRNKSRKIAKEKKSWAGRLLLNKDYDDAISIMGKNKVISTLKDNGLIVDNETNKIISPDNLPEGHKARKVYETDEELEALRKASIPAKSSNGPRYLGGEEGYLSQSTGASKGSKVNGQSKVHKRSYTIDPKTGEKIYSNKESIRKGNEGWNKDQVIKGASFGNQNLGSDKAKEQLRKAQQRQDESYDIKKEAERWAALDNTDSKTLKDLRVFNTLKGFRF